jgi:hypothetical protein
MPASGRRGLSVAAVALMVMLVPVVGAISAFAPRL